MNNSEILRVENLSKKFPGVLALDNVNLTINNGEIHCLLGENGAGKSTFIKILTGVHKNDSGKIYFQGREIKKLNTEIALNELKIIPIYQELSLVSHLSVYENIFLGNEKRMLNGLLINRRWMINCTNDIFNKLNQNINPTALVSSLSIAKQQIVEIAKALSREANILILDEPTSSLGEKDAYNLFEILFQLRNKKTAIIYITHKLDEVRKLADKITIFRDGKKVITEVPEKLTDEDIIKHMVGRTLKNIYPKKSVKPEDEVVFETKDIKRKNVLKNISFKLYKGEVLGIAGLVGSGRTETLKAIFGADKIDHGEIYLNGKRIEIKHPYDSLKNGLALIVENRKEEGLFLDQDISFNISIVSLLKNYFTFGFIKVKKENKKAEELIDSLKIKTPSLRTLVNSLSGGNQQKIIIAKWLNVAPEVFLFDEPTRGIDVGAKYEIYNIIFELAKTGKSIIMVSSELGEILGICDRVLVMSKGEIVAEFKGEKATQETVMKKMIGV